MTGRRVRPGGARAGRGRPTCCFSTGRGRSTPAVRRTWTRSAHLVSSRRVAWAGRRAGVPARWSWCPCWSCTRCPQRGGPGPPACPGAAATWPTSPPTSPAYSLGMLAATRPGQASWRHDRAGPPVEVGVELTGRLLVATPELGDAHFERSVVLVLDHDEDGALGVVINRPTPVDVGRGAARVAAAGERARRALPGRPGRPRLRAGPGRRARGATRTRSRWAGGAWSGGSGWSTSTPRRRSWRPR